MKKITKIRAGRKSEGPDIKGWRHQQGRNLKTKKSVLIVIEVYLSKKGTKYESPEINLTFLYIVYKYLDSVVRCLRT